MDRHRGGGGGGGGGGGDRYSINPDSSNYYRQSRGPSRSSFDSPMNHHQRRSPTNFRGGSGFSDSLAGGDGGGGGPRNRPFDSPPRHPPSVVGFRPTSFGGGGGGIGSNFQVPISGQKRGFPFSGRGGSPDQMDGGSFAKLFVGSVPKTAIEDDIRPLFEEHGRVIEVALIKDKRTGQQQGCCFIKYATSEEADRAIRALHNQYTLPGGTGPIQVRYADGERERLGAVEYKLFVGSLNKQATEKEVEEIFLPYGRVEDVYLMRDDLKQSRGCGFVKFSNRDMAMTAINALNGIYTMRGCDQPLTVRFADPKRPRAGESRVPAFGGPGSGPKFPSPAVRPPPNLGDPMSGRPPPNAFHPISPQNPGAPLSNASGHGFGTQPHPRSGDAAMSSNPGGPLGGLGGPVDGSLPGLAVSSSSAVLQSFNQPLLQVPSLGQQISPLQKPLQSPQHLPPSLQLLHPQNPASYAQTQTSHVSLRPVGQLQIPHSAGPTPFSQALSSHQMPGLSGQMASFQLQVQQNASSATAEQKPLNINLQPHAMSAMANQQQPPAAFQQQLRQPPQQSASQLAQMLSQQTQALQASFQSSQQAFSQLQQQLQLMQPANQSSVSQQNSQQQSQWAGVGPQTVASTPAITPPVDTPTTTSAVPAVHVVTQTAAPAKCNWTEHTAPDGYKYYYNNVTGESKWEKPEEFTSFEQQQKQQQKPLAQQPQTQSHLQGLSMQQVPQTQQTQLQTTLQTQFHHQQQQLQQPLPSLYQGSGARGHPNVQELSYSQLQVAGGSINDPARFQQGLQAAQEWMWKNKSAGT